MQSDPYVEGGVTDERQKAQMGEERVTGADGHRRAGRGRRWPPKIEFSVRRLTEGS